MNADGTKIKKILRAGSKIGARAIEKQIINLPQPIIKFSIFSQSNLDSVEEVRSGKKLNLVL